MTECAWCGFPNLRRGGHASFCPEVNPETLAVLGSPIPGLYQELRSPLMTGVASGRGNEDRRRSW